MPTSTVPPNRVTGGGGWFPYRRTQLEIDIPESVSARHAFYLTRTAGELGRNRLESQPHNVNVLHIRGIAWLLGPFGGEGAQIATDTYSDAVIPAADMTVHGSMFSAVVAAPPTDIPGSLVLAGVSSLPAWHRRLPTGTDISAYYFTGDAASYPAPVSPIPDLQPLDRVFIGKVTYPVNTPFALTFATPRNFYSTDGLYQFYFGGNADVDPATPGAGAFCLAIRGSGLAFLWERDPSVAGGWKLRLHFRYHNGNNIAGTLQWLYIIPFGRRSVAIGGQHLGGIDTGRGSLFETMTILAVSAVAGDKDGLTTWQDSSALTGHRHLTSLTGAGPIRLDQRRTLRSPHAILRVKYGLQGDLYDSPYTIPGGIPAGTPMWIYPHGYLLDPAAGGSTLAMTPAVFEAGTNTALSTNPDGSFVVTAARGYYVRWRLTSDNGWQTPVLTGYDVSIPGLTNTRAGAPTVVSIQGFSATGPDGSAGMETANINLKDVKNQATLLRGRDKVRCRLKVTDRRTNAVLFYAAEGVTRQPQAARIGRTHHRGFGSLGAEAQYPAKNWHDFQRLPMVGMWARLAEQRTVAVYNFSRDPGPDGKGVQDPKTKADLPWIVKQIVYFLLHEAGFEDHYIDIPIDPAKDMRLWAPASEAESWWIVQPGIMFTQLIERLCHDFLGMVLHWEPNYGTADGTLGQWILVPNAPAQPPFTPPVATFCKNRIQDGKKRRATNLKSYGDGSGSGLYVPILDRSLVTRPREAEFNFLQVTTTGEIYAQDSSSQKISATYKNSMSWDEDPAHPTAVEYLADGRPNPDYIGHFRPVWVVDPTLPDRAACDLVARRYWDFAGHGQLWLEFRAPMVTIDDGNPALQGRSRPLRIMDIVAFDELDIAGVTKKNVSGVVRSCNPDSHDDRMSEAEYEVIVYPSGLPDA